MSDMTARTEDTSTVAPRSWWIGRGDLSVGILALVAAGLLIAGTITMEVRGDQEPGPQFFPIIVSALLAFTGGWVTIAALLPRRAKPEVWHRPDISEDMLADLSGTNTEVISLEATYRRGRRRRTRVPSPADPGVLVTGPVDTSQSDVVSFDWRTFGIVLGATVAFAVLLEPVGWILSAAMLFWLVAHALGSKRPIFDIGVGLLMSSLVQIAFSAGLGLTLPSGIIGWIF